MEPQKRRLLLISGALIFVLGVLIAAVSHHPPKETYTTGTGFYYTGSRFNHNTGQWVSGDGKAVPPPANLTPAEIAAEKTDAVNRQKRMMVPKK